MSSNATNSPGITAIWSNQYKRPLYLIDGQSQWNLPLALSSPQIQTLVTTTTDTQTLLTMIEQRTKQVFSAQSKESPCRTFPDLNKSDYTLLIRQVQLRILCEGQIKQAKAISNSKILAAYIRLLVKLLNPVDILVDIIQAVMALLGLLTQGMDQRFQILIRNAAESSLVVLELWNRRLLRIKESHYQLLLDNAKMHSKVIRKFSFIQELLPVCIELFPGAIGWNTDWIANDPGEAALWVAETLAGNISADSAYASLNSISRNSGSASGIQIVLTRLKAQGGKGQRHCVHCQTCNVQVIGDLWKCRPCYTQYGTDTAYCSVCVVKEKVRCVECNSAKGIIKRNSKVVGDCDYCRWAISSDVFAESGGDSDLGICAFCHAIWENSNSFFVESSGIRCASWTYMLLK
ncbi:hypothetical protein BDR26DRAFT_915270 [Obelidium mucronatum]|nr:hypothetical protein BDR26DRAFT_915270 [Obelidium mucronatum]